MDSSESESESKSKYAQNGKLLLVSATLLLLIIIIITFLHSFRRSCFHRRRRRRRVPINSAAVVLNAGIQPSLLASLPTSTHSSSARGDYCAVCMSEFDAGDDCRALPTCRHAFHSDCIDAWVRSHSNCPLCRTPVQLPVRPDRTGSGDVESALPEPVWCTRKPLRENSCGYAPPEALVDHNLKLYHQN